MEATSAADQEVLTCEQHGDVHELLYCTTCKCLLCQQCYGPSSLHLTHLTTDLVSGKSLLNQNYQRMLTSIDRLYHSAETAFSEAIESVSTAQALETVNRVIDSAVSQLEAVRVGVTSTIETLATNEAASLEVRRGKLRVATEELRELVSSAMNGRLRDSSGNLQETIDQYQRFERTYRNFEARDVIAVSATEQIVAHVEALLEHSEALVSRVEEAASSKFTDVSTEALIMVGSFGGAHQTIALDLEDNKWYSLSSQSINRDLALSTWLNNKLIVAGCYTYDQSVVQYEPISDTWSALPDLLVDRNCHAMVNLNGNLFVIGGTHLGMCLNIVERFDMQRQQWTHAPSLLVARAYFAAVAALNSIVVIGGVKNEALRDCEMLGLQNKSWKLIGRLNTGRCLATAAAVLERVFVFGGEDENYRHLYDAEQYSMWDDKWTVLSTNLYPHRVFFATSTSRGVYLVGNCGDNDFSTKLQVFNPKTHECADVVVLPYCCRNLSVGSVMLSVEELSKFSELAL